ncbi:MAG: DUF2235 domain-containing protein [Acidobacteriota bacterium]
MAGKTIVLCLDGTNNEFGRKNTNVVRLAQVAVKGDEQVVYYDPGVGTMPDPSTFTRLGKWLSRIMGLAFGLGLGRNVGQAYRFLMQNYEDGDRIFIFGFSRGAYTARVLAGLIHQLGLLRPGLENLVEYAVRLSAGVNDLDGADDREKDGYWETCKSFRKSFSRSRQVEVDGELTTTHRIPIEFLGLWDTVSSVGWVWEPKRFPYTAKNDSVRKVRHAISLDERRCFYRPNRWRGPGVTDVVQLWFPGVHSDVGGGYEKHEDRRLWQASLDWMLDEAVEAGLKLEEGRREHVHGAEEQVATAWRTDPHRSLTAAWWPAELFPKLPAGRGMRLPRLGLGRRRVIEPTDVMHRSVLDRLRSRDVDYDPPNLPREFVDRVLALDEVPESLQVRGE